MVGRTKCEAVASSASLGPDGRAVTQTTRRGRPRAGRDGVVLTRELVLRTAIQVADADGGEDAITLRRIAEIVGVHPTSIYNHVPNKEAIINGMIDVLLAEADLPTEVADWQTWIREIASTIRRVARAHPGAFNVFLRHAGTGPFAARHIEAALDAFRREGCGVEQAARAVHGVLLAVMGLALEEGVATAPVVAPDLSHLDRTEHPRIFEVEDARVDDAPSEPTWDLMVESLIAGFAATLPLGERRPSRRGTRS
jgi:AcrR family transcriptional regulator